MLKNVKSDCGTASSTILWVSTQDEEPATVLRNSITG